MNIRYPIYEGVYRILTQIPAQSPPSRNRFHNRCGRNRIAGGHQSGKDEYRIAGTRTSGPARDGF